ncbi:uncharacterized protein LOC144101083 [Amblyomma americanum]
MTQDSLQLQSCVAREVKKRPCLYDSDHIGRWSKRRRESYWQDIADAVNAAAPPSPPRSKPRFFSAGVSAMDCQHIWKTLRGRYLREVRLGTRRAPDGTLIRARSQWALFRRLDFLRDHIRPRTRLQDSIQADANGTDCVEYTDTTEPALVSDDVGAGRREGEVVSPVDLEFDVYPGSSDVDDPGLSDGGARVPGSPATAPPTVAPTSEGTTDGRGRHRPPSAVPPVVPTVPPHRGGSERGTERNNTRSEDQGQRRRRREGDAHWTQDDRGEEEAQKSADLESALCRFLTATVRTVTSWTTPGVAPAESATGRNAGRRPQVGVNADDADALFLLGLRDLMGALDDERKSRAQIDILRLLRERVADGAAESDGNAGRATGAV